MKSPCSSSQGPIANPFKTRGLAHQRGASSSRIREPEGLRKYIQEIRRVLGDHAGKPVFIETLPKRWPAALPSWL